MRHVEIYMTKRKASGLQWTCIFHFHQWQYNLFKHKRKNKAVNAELAEILTVLKNNGETLNNDFKIDRKKTVHTALMYPVPRWTVFAQMFSEKFCRWSRIRQRYRNRWGKCNRRTDYGISDGKDNFGISSKYDGDLAYRIVVVRYAMLGNRFARYKEVKSQPMFRTRPLLTWMSIWTHWAEFRSTKIWSGNTTTVNIFHRSSDTPDRFRNRSIRHCTKRIKIIPRMTPSEKPGWSSITRPICVGKRRAEILYW